MREPPLHCIDVLQSFHGSPQGRVRRASSRCSPFGGLGHGSGSKPTPWANNLLEAVREEVLTWPAGYFLSRVGHRAGNRGTGRRVPGQWGQAARGPAAPNLCIVEYNDGTNSGGQFSGNGVGWTFAGARSRAEKIRRSSQWGRWVASSGPSRSTTRANVPTSTGSSGDDADRKGAVQCGAAACVHRDCEQLHGFKLAGRPVLRRRTHRPDAIHEHEISLDPRTALSNGAAAAEYSLYSRGFAISIVSGAGCGGR